MGQGGYGITYLATQANLDRKVAIKEFFMKEYCERSEESADVTMGTYGSRELVLRYREKFKKEALTLAKFKHPNIVSVMDVFEENNTSYYVMEYADGPSLSQILHSKGLLSFAEALSVIRQVANAVSYIHQYHVCHYDIKPGNILTNAEGAVLLADFGLAKQYDEQGEETSTTPVGKSKGYAPIEQYQAGGVTEFSPETDIYALAATLYKLLTGVTPVESLRRTEEEIDFLLLPADLIAPLCKALSLRRKERYHSVADFLDALPEREVKIGSDDDETTPEDFDRKEVIVTPGGDGAEKLEKGVSKQVDTPHRYAVGVAVLSAIVVTVGIWLGLRPKPTPTKLTGVDSTEMVVSDDTDTMLFLNSAVAAVTNTNSSNTEKPEMEQLMVNIESETLNLSPLEQAKKKYKRVWGFVNDRAVVVSQDEKQGYINRQGDEVIPCKYDDAFAFYNGLGAVSIGNKRTFVNKQGQEVVPLEEYEELSNYEHGYVVAVLNGKTAIYDYEGNVIVPYLYEAIEGYENDIMAVCMNGKWGYVTKGGQSITTFQYDAAYGFHDGLAQVIQNGLYGMIDPKGNVVIPFKYKTLQPYSEGLIGAQLNGKWGFIDRNEQTVIPFLYDWALVYENGKARVRQGHEDFYINKQGQRL